MSLMKYSALAVTPPSYDVPEDEHCCDCDGCWIQDKECPYGVPQFCIICNDKSTLAIILQRDYDLKKPMMEQKLDTGSKFWICDKHLEDQNVLSILKEGIPTKISRNRKKMSAFVRDKLENK